jgi:protein-L-isoaspartate O-methyltransferase
MDRDTELEIVRRAYAKRVMFAAGIHDRRVEAAFASVPREHFLGRGPWSILRWNRGYVPTPSRNPVYILVTCSSGLCRNATSTMVNPGCTHCW